MYRIIHKLNYFYEYIKTQIIRKNFFGKIGRRTIIYKPLLVMNPQNIFISNDVIIEKRSTLYSVCSYNGENYNGIIKIGNNVYINHDLNITSANQVIIEDEVTLAYNVSIFDFDHDYLDINKNINKTDLLVKGSVIIKEQSWIGMNVAILGNVTIGKHCIIGANTVITKSIPDYCMAVGNPAKIIKKYNFETKQWEKVTE